MEHEQSRRMTMSDNLRTVGVLTLSGKRVTGYTTSEVYEGQALIDTDELAHVDIELVQRLAMRENLLCYFEDGEIHDLEYKRGDFNKSTIIGDGEDSALYRVECDESMDFIITQKTGHSAPNTLIRREPVEGVIELEVDSKVIGSVMVYGVSDHYYTNEATILVK
jgi:hypothetical protein